MYISAAHPHELIEDELGNQILHFTIAHLAPFATKLINIEVELAVSNTPYPASPQDLDTFLQAEKYVESDAPEVSALARQLKGPNSLETAKRIFQWVATHVQYSGYARNDRGALYALKRRQGDCTEYMYLFVALCRAGGIPARGVGGFVCDADGMLHANAYHNWAEFFADGAWRIADPQKKVFGESPSRYIAMQLMGNSAKNPMGESHRFRFSGAGLSVKMN